MKKLIIFLFLLPALVSGQNKIIRGNGNPKSQKFSLTKFSKLDVNLYADINVMIGSMPMIEIAGDANVISHITTNIKDNTLSLHVEDGYWIENSKPVINVSVPFLTEIKTTGLNTNIGKIVIENIDVGSFKVDQLFGEILLVGKTKELIIESSNNSYYRNSGYLDASKLTTETLKATIKGSNTAKVFVTKDLDAKLLHDANLTYEGNPISVNLIGNASKDRSTAKVEEKAKKSVREKLTYVSVEIKNGSAFRRNFVIAGPNGAGGNFSYGFPLNPFASKKENIPVGTKFYAETLGKRGKKLVEITIEDNGKTIKL